MSEQKFPNGTVVRLKSGGPKMTIVGYGEYDYGSQLAYSCKWFEGNALTSNTFTEAELEEVLSGTGSVRLERA